MLSLSKRLNHRCPDIYLDCPYVPRLALTQLPVALRLSLPSCNTDKYVHTYTWGAGGRGHGYLSNET